MAILKNEMKLILNFNDKTISFMEDFYEWKGFFRGIIVIIIIIIICHLYISKTVLQLHIFLQSTLKWGQVPKQTLKKVFLA